MKKLLLLLIVILAGYSPAECQQPPVVLRAHKADVDVRDGNMLYHHYWTASPSVPEDIYYAHRFSGKNRISFISDMDSVTFDVTLGNTYPFVILLDGKDSCHTLISTLRQTYYKLGGSTVDTDTIPFSLGQDGRVYIAGSINGSAPLKLFFDNGADNTIFFPSAFEKGLKILFDDSVQNNGTGGVVTRATSNRATVQLNGMHWDNEMVMYVDKQIGDHADGTIGYDLFENKIIELDYDKMLFIVHNKPFALDKGYEKFNMHFNGGQIPSISLSLVTADTSLPRQFIFDMGATGCMFINGSYAKKYGLYEKLKQTGESVRSGAGTGISKTLIGLLPGLQLGRYTLHNLPVNLQNRSEANDDAEEIGMDILKRFNTVLDFQSHKIYLKPNHLLQSPYKSYNNAR